MRGKFHFPLAAAALTAIALAQTTPKTGPEVGQHVPSFTATDQTGKGRTLPSVLGPKGGLLVFYRSADW